MPETLRIKYGVPTDKDAYLQILDIVNDFERLKLTPITTTPEMVQPVGRDKNGKLYTKSTKYSSVAFDNETSDLKIIPIRFALAEYDGETGNLEIGGIYVNK